MAKRIFVSWASDRSFVLAEQLQRWLPSIVPGIKIFYSPDISGGYVWLTKLLRELTAADYGIICVSKENQASPWLHFELGALWQRAHKEIPVCPLLLDLPTKALKQPLSFFQAKRFDKKGTLELCRSIAEGEDLSIDQLRLTFKAVWPQLHKDVKSGLRLLK